MTMTLAGRKAARAAMITIAPVALSLLAGCATPETRVRTALVDAGLTRPVAGCMAERMTDRLSLFQLQKLSRLPRLTEVKDRDGRIDLDRLVRNSKALQDPEIISVITSSGLICMVRHPNG